ncbi:hypothetical protein QKU58_gp150 [Pyramimonas orientalis virus]|uniref:J domain-containing protein n=1 Tax=Pyramimonas orientalis virus 01B TaxID=3134525 RepID=A0A7M4CES1_9VIRU|nr:hypothetical protein QKU58_gp150 [Pyramimonas orientalis virus]QOI90181.1 hypothetical protein HWQ62_00044 [Pyramimonas orientalis virus]
MDESDKTFYEILNVDTNSSLDEIKRQYRLNALKYHPDKETGDENLFKLINSAYETLSDADKRSAYDSKQVKYEGSKRMHNFFENIFEVEEEQQKVVLRADLNDVLYGCYKKYDVRVTVPCVDCKETGILNPDKNTIQCRECFGKGVNPMMAFLSCMTCNGKGIFIINRTMCKKCDGNRMLHKHDERTIYLKPGIKNNAIISVSKCLVLLIEHHYENTSLKIIDMDIHLYVEITLLELLCGFVKEVSFGHEVFIIQSVKVFDYQKPVQLKKKGIAETGDLLIHFNLIVDVSNALYGKIGQSLNQLLKTNLEFKPTGEENVVSVQ